MSFNKETKPEKDKIPHPFEQRPKPDIVRELGKKAVEGASKDKPKK